MAKTFSIRSQVVVNEAPPVNGLKDFLMQLSEDKRSIKRITTVNLEPTSMAKLDQYSPKMMSLMSSSGGAAKMNIQPIMNMLLEVDSRREAAICYLVVYLREKEEEHLNGVDNNEDCHTKRSQCKDCDGGERSLESPGSTQSLFLTDGADLCSESQLPKTTEKHL